MKTFWQKTSWRVAAVALLAAWSAGMSAGMAAGAQPAPPAENGEDGARAEARGLINQALERRVVRRVAPACVEAEARRLAGSLSAERLQALLESRDADSLIDQRRAETAAAKQGLTAAAQSSGPRPLAAPQTLAVTGAKALGDAGTDLVFVPVAPCRIIDTRLVSAGALAAGEKRDFLVAGTNAFLAQGGNGGGCGIPDGVSEPAAPAVVINFVAVGPAGPGDLRAWEYGQPVPTASIINYSNVPGLNIANGVVVPIEGTSLQPFDLSLQADVNATHVVADVTGYFTRFNNTQLARSKDILVASTQSAATDLSDGACHRITTCTVVAPAGANGKVVIRSLAQISINHTQGTHDRVVVGAKLGVEDPPNCTPVNDQVANMDFEIPDVGPTAPDVDVTIYHGREFSQPGGTTRTYALLSNMIIGASAGDQIDSARMICMFIPD